MTEVPARLLQLLVCPRCKGPLDMRAQEQRLDCQNCRVGYPVRDGIPIMLVDEAVPLRA